ncbi:hypothetical protein BR93DRAFT_925154 [Coniochaeta sp. PMI_546]|nr:hypothetical protein BR93DRAFT_925154 [Coniochaeta sp. PMI_546]
MPSDGVHFRCLAYTKPRFLRPVLWVLSTHAKYTCYAGIGLVYSFSVSSVRMKSETG